MTISVRAITLFLALALLFGGGAIGLNLVMAQDANGEYDADGDRLIEISNLEQLNAVRYDLSDGNGRPDDSDDARDYRAAFPTSAGESVCDRACRGYELARSLDFNSPDSYSAGAVDPEWNGGDGWLPINDNGSGLNAEFEGNGHTISNLYIHRQDTDSVGLFASVGGSGIIRNAGVVNAEMEGRSYTGILAGTNSGTITDSYATGSVSGDDYVGGLAGTNSGTITDSYATGSVSGDDYVGGLAGTNSGTITDSYATGSVSGNSSVGGLVGHNINTGAITASYATGSVSGDDYVGGLVGHNRGTITASYATGSVSGKSSVGGLAGLNNRGTITASYATGSVSGNSSVGGLAGQNINSGAITDSYWNTDIFGAGTYGVGKTTAQLQSPTGYTGIYRDWNADLDNADRDDDDATGADDFWDFGTSSQYPALKADIDGDGDATASEFGGQHGDAPAPTPLVFIEGANGEYDADGDRLIEISNLEQLNAVRYDLSDGNGRPDDSDDARDYRAAFPTSAGESVCDRACRGYELARSLDFNSPDSYSAGAVDPEWNGGDGWLPINDNGSGLNAEFEGNGHTISNLYIHRQDTDSVGLFASVGGSGIIRNAGVVNAEMEGRSYTGILAGTNSGTITDSYATGSVSGDDYVGGLAGTNSGTITDSYATGSVSGDDYVGGLAGTNSGTITDSYATGSVSGNSSVGGLVGHNINTGAITASYATGSVSGDDYVGGLVGHNRGTITASYATGSVSGKSSVGGLAGLNNRGTITASYATGSVSGNSSVGGLAGQNINSGAITDSYWNTDIFGAGTYGVGKTTAQLQSPTGYTGIYRDWNADLDNADRDDDDATGADDFWDFGTSSQYPALKADIDGDGDATASEFGGQHGDAPAPTPLVFIEGANGEYDADGDRLIEISNLEQLNAVRYDLSDGNGRPDDSDDARDYRAAFPTSAGESVCDRACRGYELARSLDFNSPDSYSAGAVDPEWNGGDGWLPINDNGSGLNAEFEGNGHTISNLYIHRQDTDSVGLFASVGGSGIIRNAGVVNAKMEGRSYTGILAGTNSGTITDSYATGSVSGDDYVGGLAGTNSGTITDSYATGSVSGDDYVGGLVGGNSSGGAAITASYATGSVSGNSSVGGLVGHNINTGAITASYATGSVSGDDYVGGLVGHNRGTITASYATGSVSGKSSVGGLAGLNNRGTITASYATGSVSGNSSVGGLAGQNINSGAITDSYWNTDIFGAGTYGVGKTTAQLQSPTGYTGIYRDWNADLDNADRNDDDATGADDFWDFGTSSQYPALKADIDGDGAATASEFGRQRMNTPPEFPAAQAERSVPENPAEGENIGVPVVAEDAEDDTLTYALGGADAASFDIVPSSGQLQTKAALDYETKFSYTVTVSVDDGQDAEWNADETSDATVTVTITVTDVDETPEVTGEAAVDYQENGAGAVAAYTATEPDNDPITWSLSGPDMGAFDIGSGGELTFNTPPDFEGPTDADTDNVYKVAVEASDGGATPGTLEVTVTVANVDETPEVTGKAAVMDYQENGVGAVAAYTATEPDNDPITWSLSGPDMGAFGIGSGGELTFNTPPDFEGPTDGDTDNVYEVTVEASDGGATPGTLDVTITVTDVGEPGSVTLSSPNPQLGVPLMATLNDPEGVGGGVTWQWASSSDRSTWTDIDGATSETYTPVAEDEGKYLRATAEYTDGEGSSSTAEAVSDALVTTNIAPEFPATETGERSVLESRPEGGYIGAPVAANDANDDTLTYTLGGADAGSFDIDGSTGQIKVGAGTTPDPAVRDTYTVVVTATDPSGADDTITVTITVTGLLTQYDSDGNGAISKNEAIAAVRDYFSGNLTKEQTIAVIRLYFVSGG